MKKIYFLLLVLLLTPAYAAKADDLDDDGGTKVPETIHVPSPTPRASTKPTPSNGSQQPQMPQIPQLPSGQQGGQNQGSSNTPPTGDYPGGKLLTQPCPVGTPGQSLLNFDGQDNDSEHSMWGQDKVAKYTDKRPLLGQPGCDPLIPSTCAHDINGQSGETVATIAKWRTSELNWWYFEKKLGVTRDEDYNALNGRGKAEIAPEGSNQQIAAKEFKVSSKQVATADRNGHEVYRNSYPGTMERRAGYVPPGSEKRMAPKNYQAGQLTNSADMGNPQGTGENPIFNDTKVTEDCRFVSPTGQDIKNMPGNPNGDWIKNMQTLAMKAYQGVINDLAKAGVSKAILDSFFKSLKTPFQTTTIK